MGILVLVALWSLVACLGAYAALTRDDVPARTPRPAVRSACPAELDFSEREADLFPEIIASWLDGSFHWWKNDVIVACPTVSW